MNEMHSFYGLWALLKPEGEYKRRKGACERLWGSYDEETRQYVYGAIVAAKERGEWINPNPYFAIEDVVIRAREQNRQKQTLSYSEYYKRYGTTEEREGWKMVNPTGNKVMYVNVER